MLAATENKHSASHGRIISVRVPISKLVIYLLTDVMVSSQMAGLSVHYNFNVPLND